MSDKYDLSIIIPHYNTPELLEKLLSTIPDSNRIQTIIVDDHSSEDVKQKLQVLEFSYKGRPFFFYENNGKQSAGAARNVGLEHAEGKWLLFADADDYFVDEFYDSVSPWFESPCDLIYFRSTSIDLETGTTDMRHLGINRYIDNYLDHPGRKTEIALRSRFYAPVSKLIRSSLIDEYEIFFDEIPIAEDVLFSVKAGFYAESIAASDQVIYCIARRARSLIGRQDLESFEIRAQTEIRAADFLRVNLSPEDYRFVSSFTAAYEYLFKIIKRRYGVKVFIKYLKLFAKHHMLRISLSEIRPDTIRRAFQIAKE